MDNSRDKIRSSGRHRDGREVCVLQHGEKRPTEILAKIKSHLISSEKARAGRIEEEERIWKEVEGNKV